MKAGALRRTSGEMGGRAARRSAAHASVPDDVIARIKSLVQEKRYGPGTRLPSEREMAEQLGISRPSVREALRTLAVMGVLETRQGSGTQVAPTSANILRAPFEFLLLLDRPDLVELYEARELLEVYLAEQAAERRTAEDLLEIHRALCDMEATIDVPERMTEPNVRFHRSIARAAHNVVLERILNGLCDGIEACVEATRPAVEDFRKLYEVHERIYDAIRRRDRLGARRGMTVHMAMALDELRRLAAGMPSET